MYNNKESGNKRKNELISLSNKKRKISDFLCFYY